VNSTSQNSARETPRRSSIKRSNSSSSDEDDDLYDLQPPAKQYASADRVAAKLSGLSLNKEKSTISITKGGKSVQVIEIEELTDDESHDDPSETNGVIELSDEAHSFIHRRRPTDHLVNEIIKNELSKPSKALVPWVPPIISSPPVTPVVDDEETASSSNKIGKLAKTSVSGGVIIREISDDQDVVSLMTSTPIIQEDDDLIDQDLEPMEEDFAT
jgi:hypothetical protein